jgi:hypothetical protein
VLVPVPRLREYPLEIPLYRVLMLLYHCVLHEGQLHMQSTVVREGIIRGVDSLLTPTEVVVMGAVSIVYTVGGDWFQKGLVVPGFSGELGFCPQLVLTLIERTLSPHSCLFFEHEKPRTIHSFLIFFNILRLSN